MIGFRRGHNFQAVGSRGYVKEEVIAEQIRQEIKTIFDDYNYKYVDCSPGNMSSSEDIKYGVDMCNRNGCELFFSIHLNASKKTDAPVGCEIWTYNEKFKEAQNVLSNLVGLGFKNRGIKHNKGYYELKNTKCKAMIIEVFFVDSKADVDILEYNGIKRIAEAIAFGVMGIEKPVEKPIESNWKYRVCVGSYSEYQNAVNKKNELKKLGIESFIVKKED